MILVWHLSCRFSLAMNRDLLPLLTGPRGSLLLLGVTLLSFFYSGVQSHPRLGTGGDAGPWALYLGSYVFLTGTAAGAVILGIVLGGSGQERWRAIERIAELSAAVSLALAGLFLLLDLGRPDRWRFLLGQSHLASPFATDLASMAFHLGIVIALGHLGARVELVEGLGALPTRRRPAVFLGRLLAAVSPRAAARERARLLALAAVSVPAAVLLHAAGVPVLGLLGVRPFWESALLGPVFVFPTLVSGLALVILVAASTRTLPRPAIEAEALRGLSRVLLLSIPLLTYCVFAEAFAIVLAGHGPGGLHVLEEIVVGAYASLFWPTVAGGLILPFLLLVGFPGRRSTTFLSALLVLLGVLADRLSVVVASLQGHAHPPFTPGGYTPTSPEILYTLAAYAVGLGAFVVLARRLPSWA